ncbi:MAG: peroxiredoxin [Nitrososphaerota archaeon]
MLRAGDTAPDFELPDQGGRPVRLSRLLQKGPVVLYFYPRDESPGCTKEACAFRDSYEAFMSAGAQVVGVSSDSVESHARFAQRHRLPFTLLSDEGGRVRALYRVPKSFGLLPGRVTFIIDRGGTIRHVFSSQLRYSRHVQEALRILQALKAEEQGGLSTTQAGSALRPR